MKQEYLFECEDCKSKFYLNNGMVELNYAIPHKSKSGRSIFITYYDCPKCGRRHYVQIDDTHSSQLKKQTSRMFTKLSKKRINGDDIPKNQNERFKKLNRELEDYRFELKKEFDGQFIVAEDGSDVEVHFSM